MDNDFGKNRTRMHSDEEIHPDALVRVMKKEKSGEEPLKDIPPTPKNYKRFRGEEESFSLPRGVLWGVIGLIVLFVGGSLFSVVFLRETVKSSLISQATVLQGGVRDLEGFNSQSAQEKFDSLKSNSKLSSPNFQDVVDVFGFLFKGSAAAVKSFRDLASRLSGLAGKLNWANSSIINFLSGTNGDATIAQLSDIRNTLAAIDSDSDQLSGTIASMGDSAFYLPLKAEIEGAERMLDATIPWLSDGEKHHLLVLFENTSEMRPGGGFLGSFADVTVASGTITDISFHDIADIDTAFKKDIIPPKALQLETKRFRPADANWFLDFPTSASKTIQFFEGASPSSTSYEGVIAISPRVVSDLLSLTGPITVGSTTFTSDNFLMQIQNIVQKGQAISATYPKAIVGDLAHSLLAAFTSSTPETQQQLLASFADWFSKRDVMLYFTSTTFENFAITYGAAGEVYALPQNFNGDYLAIADANIRGDKTDLFVKQNIRWDAQIDADGMITDTVNIERIHTGNTSPYWWYQTTNQDYLQLFVPSDASLTDETGGLRKMIQPPIDYRKSQYVIDPTVFNLESSTVSLLLYPAVTTHLESGKKVFATWTQVRQGASSSLEFDYTHRAAVVPGDGTEYQFIFEKQAGSSRTYDIEIDAPLGYVFKENHLATYEYTSEDMPGRLIINLTLQKL